MNKINFSEIAAQYEKNSLVQKSVAEILISLISVGGNDDILDLGCGTGLLTKKLRQLTKGKVVGIDASEGMIKEARKKLEGEEIALEIKKAEELDYDKTFDVIFCNSSFQWFKNIKSVVDKCYRALREKGRIGIQAPAKKIYSPNFIQAIKKVANNPKTMGIFTFFKSPWFFLDTSEEYKSLFEQAGFRVPFAKIDTLKTLHPSEEVYKIFRSGAAAGYLNQEFYETQIDRNYIENFRDIVRDTFKNQTNSDGLVELIFNRIYLVAVKE